MMKELSKTGYSLAVIQAIALRMAFACWLLFMTFPMLAQEHSVSLHLNHVYPYLRPLMRLNGNQI